jgi:hypothetical protein
MEPVHIVVDKAEEWEETLTKEAKAAIMEVLMVPAATVFAPNVAQLFPISAELNVLI